MNQDILTKSLSAILKTPQARSAERVGILTLADFAHVIELFGLVRMHSSEGKYYFPGSDAPTLKHFGKLAWSTVLKELSAAGFDWRTYEVHPHGFYMDKTDTDLRLTMERQVNALISLLREYQRRSSANSKDTNQRS